MQYGIFLPFRRIRSARLPASSASLAHSFASSYKLLPPLRLKEEIEQQSVSGQMLWRKQNTTGRMDVFPHR